MNKGITSWTDKENMDKLKAIAPNGWKEIEGGKEAGHTPTPWQVTHLRRGTGFTNAFRIGSGPFGEIARTSESAAEEENEANARFICLAVNSHEALMALAQAVASSIKTDETTLMQMARAALNKAKGEK